MDQAYTEWIAENVKNSTCKCAETTLAMQKAFPELIRVRGHYHCYMTQRRYTHWWLRTNDAEIIDPTADQYMSKGDGDYEEWDEHRQEPTGKCYNCGDYCYGRTTCCSDVCDAEYAEYVMKGMSW